MPDPSTTSPQRRLRGSKTTPSEAPSATAASGDGGERLNTAYLETLLGYNARRAALAVIAVFLRQMAPFGLRPVDFSVLTLIAHNPGVTSRQICATLDILPPNLVGMIKSLQNRSLIMRKPHPTDRRAVGLHLTTEGKRLQAEAQATATLLEQKVAGAITAEELDTLNQLLRKIYLR